MPQDYDKIFKENIEEIILPLANKILGIYPESLEEIPDDIQKTIERRPDFLKKISYSTKNIVLHIEFQKENDPEMVYRMYEYHALLLRKYKIPIQQYVFFIDIPAPTMPTTIRHENVYFFFQLYHFQDFSYRIFLESDKPEEVILAILASFENYTPEKVIHEILTRLKTMPLETFRREKCVKQSEILSKLRSLQEVVVQTLEAMALTYDLKNDVRYLQGIQKGEAKGLKKGIKKGIEKGKLKTAENCLRKGLSIEDTAELTELPLSTIQELAAKLGLKN